VAGSVDSERSPRIESALSPQRPTSTRGRQRQGESRLGPHTRSCGGSRRADGGGRLRDELIDRRSRDEAAAADDHAGELAGPEELVDGVARDATEELTSFLDGVERGFLHGEHVTYEGSRGLRVFCTVTQPLALDFGLLNTMHLNGTSGNAEFPASLVGNSDQSQRPNCRETTPQLQKVVVWVRVDPRNSGRNRRIARVNAVAGVAGQRATS